MSSKRTGKLPQFMWESYRAMSVDVGKLLPFFCETACMNPEERVMCAYIEGFKLMFPNEPDLEEFKEFLDEMVKPFYIKLGQAKWGRDVVTDLGFAKAKAKSRVEHISKIFQFVPPKEEKK